MGKRKHSPDVMSSSSSSETSSSPSGSELSSEEDKKKKKKKLTKKKSKSKPAKDKKKHLKKSKTKPKPKPKSKQPQAQKGSLKEGSGGWKPNYSCLEPTFFQNSSEKGFGWICRNGYSTFSIGHFQKHSSGGFYKNTSRPFINMSTNELKELYNKKDEILEAQLEVETLEEQRLLKEDDVKE